MVAHEPKLFDGWRGGRRLQPIPCLRPQVSQFRGDREEAAPILMWGEGLENHRSPPSLFLHWNSSVFLSPSQTQPPPSRPMLASKPQPSSNGSIWPKLSIPRPQLVGGHGKLCDGIQLWVPHHHRIRPPKHSQPQD